MCFSYFVLESSKPSKFISKSFISSKSISGSSEAFLDFITFTSLTTSDFYIYC